MTAKYGRKTRVFSTPLPPKEANLSFDQPAQAVGGEKKRWMIQRQKDTVRIDHCGHSLRYFNVVGRQLHRYPHILLFVHRQPFNFALFDTETEAGACSRTPAIRLQCGDGYKACRIGTKSWGCVAANDLSYCGGCPNSDKGKDCTVENRDHVEVTRDDSSVYLREVRIS